MQHATLIMKILTLGLATALLFTCTAIATGQDDGAAGKVDKVFGDYSESGESAASTPSYTPTQVTRSPMIEKLHEEREAGDREAFQRLEAQLRAPQADGEAACETILIPTTTTGGAGQLKLEQADEPVIGKTVAPAGITFGNDVHVRSTNHDSTEYCQAMASDSNGNLYVVWEDNMFTYTYLQVYWSADGGKNWIAFGYVQNLTHDLQSPSIAIGEGINGDTLLLAYTVSVVGGQDYPEVATCPLPPAPWSFTINSVPVYSLWEDYRDPIIVTDSHKYDLWYAYLTSEGVYEAADDNVNICTWRCADGGATWTDQNVVFGNYDEMEWRVPDITFGTSLNRVLVVTYNQDLGALYTISSDTLGTSWNSEVLFFTMLTTSPYWTVDPEIAAAIYNDNVMVCCDKWSDSLTSMVIGQGYSMDAGNTWTTLWEIEGRCAFPEYSASLTANEGGGCWHVAWTSIEEHSVIYNWRPQDLSDYWQSTAYAVNDTGHASGEVLKINKGIASNWSTDVACISWSDYRDGTPIGDYDCYVDYGDNTGLMSDRTGIDQDLGGTVNFFLNAGASNAGRYYALFGSASGTSPGTVLPGGYAVLPINWDVFTDFVLGNANVCALFLDFIGQLDVDGMADAQLNCPPIPGFAGIDLYFAFALNNLFNYASNPMTVKILF